MDQKPMSNQLPTNNEPSSVDQPSSIFQRHPLILFFSLAFLISWIFWFIEPGVREKDSITASFLIQIGTYGPVLAAMIISAILNHERAHSPLWQGLLAGGLALAAAIFSNWLLARSIFSNPSQPLNLFLLALLTLLPAGIFFCARYGSRGIFGLLNSLTRWPDNPLWLVVAFFLMPLLDAAGAMVTSLFTGKPLFSWASTIATNPVLGSFVLAFFATALYGGPLGEEPGWRGFALPRLQKRFDPLLASVYLGLIWSLWHLPLHLLGYYNPQFGNPLNGLLLRVFSTIPLTVIFTWLYNRSRGNLLVMVILHTMVNITSALIPTQAGTYAIVFIAVVFMVIFDRMYKKMPTNVVV
jgi:membrane protease YdiL (CAAX protease family)